LQHENVVSLLECKVFQPLLLVILYCCFFLSIYHWLKSLLTVTAVSGATVLMQCVLCFMASVGWQSDIPQQQHPFYDHFTSQPL